MNEQNKGILLMIACAALWSMAGVMFKYIPWHPMVITALRAFIAAAVIFCYIRIKKLRVIFSKKTLFGGLALAFTCTFFVIANKLTTAANAIVLQFTAPIFLMVFSSVFFHKHFYHGDKLAVSLTIAGISLFFLDQLSGGSLLGNIIAVAAGASMGAMYLINGEINNEERFSSVFFGQCFAVLFGLPFLFTTEVELSPLPILFIVLLGVFQLGIPYVLYALAAGKCPPLACSLLAALEPLLNPVWVMLFYGEIPGIFALIGGVAVIGAVTGWSIWSERYAKKIK